MKVRGVTLGLALVAAGAQAARAQGGSVDTQCRAGTPSERITQDACQKALDLFTYLAPQLAGGLAGGNALSGEHSVVGGPGHTSIGLRLNAVHARIPQIDALTPAIAGAVASNYRVSEHYIPVPTIDAAVGVFRGVEIGGATALGVDALLNLSVLPSVKTSDVEVSLPDGPLKLGFGARISLVSESVVTPGISLTYLRRDLPRIAVTGSPSSDEIQVNDFQVKTSAWRGVIGKNLGPIAITAGFGQDTYTTSALATVLVSRGGITTKAGPIGATQKLTRDNAFASVALNLPVVSIVGEGGRASGGSLATYNTFAGTRADDQLTYASLGMRFRF